MNAHQSAMLQRAIISLAAVFLFSCPLAAQPAPTAPLGRDHPLAGRIVQMTDAAAITSAQMADIAAARDFVLLGEKHDNPDHHRLQAWMIDALLARGRRPAIAMEMLDAEQAPALAEYAKQHPHDASGLGAAIGWKERGWPDWPMYAPIAEAALRAGSPLVPADLTRAERRAAGRDGVAGFAEPLRTRLQRAPAFDAQQSASLAQELKDSHCGQVPDEALLRMANVQWARDAHMAAAMLDSASGAVLIAGAGHVRRDRGVPWHLTHAAPARSSVALAFVEVEETRPEASDYALAGKFDYVWFTARVDTDDPCARFRDSLQRLRRP
jgi:uncharacterized iron-regulated protein